MVHGSSISVVTPTYGQLLDFKIKCNTALHKSMTCNSFHAVIYIRIFNKSHCIKSDISEKWEVCLGKQDISHHLDWNISRLKWNGYGADAQPMLEITSC